MKSLFRFLIVYLFISISLIADDDLTFSSFYDLNKIDAENQITLPLPNSSDLEKKYNKSISFLKQKNSPRVEKAQKALAQLKTRDNELLDASQSAYKDSLFSLLFFIAGDYEQSKFFANNSIIYAKQNSKKRTLPSFLYAYSSLNMSNFSYKDLTERYFKYSIVNEPDNPMIPLLFRLYFDKSMESIDDIRAVSLLTDIAKADSLSKYKVQNLTYMLPLYISKLKMTQEDIKANSLEANESVKNDPKTVKKLEEKLKSYDTLLNMTKSVLIDINSSEESKKIISYRKKLQVFEDQKELLHQKLPALKKYQKERENRSLVVAGLVIIVLVISFFMFK